MKSESGSEVRRDGRNQGGAASTLVTAAEIPSSGGKGGMTLPWRKCVGGRRRQLGTERDKNDRKNV